MITISISMPQHTQTVHTMNILGGSYNGKSPLYKRRPRDTPLRTFLTLESVLLPSMTDASNDHQ